MKKSLLLGCGNSRLKRVGLPGATQWAGELVTIDMDPNSGAAVVWNLEDRPLPFPDETFDELAAYDVLEHLGRQGDWKGFFDEFAEYWRILKPGGEFGILVPIGDHHFADPGHTRFFHQNHFEFLSQDFYRVNREAQTAASDYRWYWRRNFEVAHIENFEGHHLAVILRKAP